MRARAVRGIPGGESGFALFTVTLFIIVQIVTGLAYFAVVSYESRAASHREESSEAYYLAEGAIERARAKFLQDRSWRGGWSAVAAGRGTYDLALADTTVLGTPLVRLLATGHVGGADRAIDVLADVPPTASELALFVGGNASAGGNLCVDGAIHVNGTASFGSGDVHLTCDPDFTRGFTITPPVIYTDPAHFPGATYYYVIGYKNGSKYRAKIYDWNLNLIALDQLAGKVSYSSATKTYTFNFGSNGDINTYFNESSGVFRKNAGDQSVVVNFGEPVTNPPDTKANVSFSDPQAVNLYTTIVNTRFTGVTESDRLNTAFWTGGRLDIKQVTMTPRNGIALIAHDAQKQGGSLVQAGTAASPALFYITRDITTINSNFALTGSLIVLRNWNSTGGPNLTFDPGFKPLLPAYLREGWPSGVSGTLKIVRWRETPA